MGPFDARYGNQGAIDRPWNGSPTFYKLLEEMAVTHDSKSHDYASNSNPYGNYHFAGKLAVLFSHSEEDAGFVGRLGEKLFRLANLEGSQKIAKNESIEDTERDICVIVALWMADRRDRRAANQITKAAIQHPTEAVSKAQLGKL
jgi:hypothetical protein